MEEKKNGNPLLFIQTISTPIQQVSNQKFFDTREIKSEKVTIKYSKEKPKIKEKIVIDEKLYQKLINIIQANNNNQLVLSDIYLNDESIITGYIKDIKDNKVSLLYDEQLTVCDLYSINEIYIRSIK